MLCLFVREATLDNLLILWDFYCSHEKGVKFAFSVMHVYICAAFLIRFRNDILCKEFPGIFSLDFFPFILYFYHIFILFHFLYLFDIISKCSSFYIVPQRRTGPPGICMPLLTMPPCCITIILCLNNQIIYCTDCRSKISFLFLFNLHVYLYCK